VIVEALMARSRAGLWLALAPTRLWLFLIAGYGAALAWVPVGPTVALAVSALWARWSTQALARRTQKVDDWLRERVRKLGGEPDPKQPIKALTAYEVNARNAPRQLQSAESTRLDFMRDPGGVSRRMLAVAGLAVIGSSLTLIAITSRGLITTSLSVMAAALALTAICDLYRGGVRRWAAPWRTISAPWPSSWRVIDPPSKMLGPIWLGLGLAIALASILISHAGSIGRGVNLALLALGACAGLWACRANLGGLAAIERTTVHRWLSRALIVVAPAVWELVRAFQIVLVTLGVVACALFPIDYSCAYLGVLLFGIALMVRALRQSWQRPDDPELIGMQEVARLFGEKHLERRMTTVAGFIAPVTCVWFFVAEVLR
jgi:hypothetical protein